MIYSDYSLSLVSVVEIYLSTVSCVLPWCAFSFIYIYIYLPLEGFTFRLLIIMLKAGRTEDFVVEGTNRIPLSLLHTDHIVY